MKFIVIPIYEHTEEDEANAIIEDIILDYQPSQKPYLAEADELPKKA